jgi:hypothetical protein
MTEQGIWGGGGNVHIRNKNNGGAIQILDLWDQCSRARCAGLQNGPPRACG